MRKLILFYFLFLLPINSSYAQYVLSSQPSNLGLSFNILGPLFGEYGLGLSILISPNVQVGLNNTYYSTQYVSPEVEGWQSELRINYFFSGHYTSGFYLGAAGGFESVDIKKEENGKWEHSTDLTWAVIPGYAWHAGRSLAMMLGLSYGYSFGDVQFGPEIGFFVLL